jgi:hypothetical protein
MERQGFSFSTTIDRELVLASMTKALRQADLSSDLERFSVYRSAGIDSSHAAELDADAIRIALLYRDRIEQPIAAASLRFCVGAAALLLPTSAVAEPILSAEGAGVFAALGSLLWAYGTHFAAASCGFLFAMLFNAGKNADSDAVRDQEGR